MPANIRRVTNDVPFSQDQTKITNAPADELIAALRAMVEAEPDRIITRNHFRVYSGYAESAFSRHFGTFEEFKRQAGITLSRHAHRLEKSIAKHASVDKLRTLNADRQGWEGAYLRPSGKRWQTCVVVSDLHGLRCDPYVRRVLLDTIRRMQPAKVVLNGDIVDLAEFSRHTQDPREFQVVREIEWLHAFLADVRGAAPDAELIYNEGNHEARILCNMAEQTPALMVVLADLHGFTVPKLLGLDRFEVNYVARADLTAWTRGDMKAQLRKNYVVCWDALLFGHFPEMARMGLPGANGHHHRYHATDFYSPVYGPSTWVQTGCGHIRSASYCAAEKWSQGFLACHVDTHNRRSQFEYFDLSHAGAFVGGKWHERTRAEAVIDGRLAKRSRNVYP